MQVNKLLPQSSFKRNMFQLPDSKLSWLFLSDDMHRQPSLHEIIYFEKRVVSRTNWLHFVLIVTRCQCRTQTQSIPILRYSNFHSEIISLSLKQVWIQRKSIIETCTYFKNWIGHWFKSFDRNMCWMFQWPNQNDHFNVNTNIHVYLFTSSREISPSPLQLHYFYV